MASKEWVKFNEDSRAKRNRAKHIEKNGGHFERSLSNKGWQWVAPVEEKVVKPKPASKKNVAKKSFGKKKSI